MQVIGHALPYMHLPRRENAYVYILWLNITEKIQLIFSQKNFVHNFFLFAVKGEGGAVNVFFYGRKSFSTYLRYGAMRRETKKWIPNKERPLRKVLTWQK